MPSKRVVLSVECGPRGLSILKAIYRAVEEMGGRVTELFPGEKDVAGLFNAVATDIETIHVSGDTDAETFRKAAAALAGTGEEQSHEEVLRKGR